VRTGKLLWTCHTIPRPGEFGNDTWEQESWATNGNAGVWTQISVDEDLGLVYLPVETPTSDFYGGHRPGNNLFGESLVCVDLRTGQRKWFFQFVHHPLWNFDNSSAPLILDITVGGRPIKAVAVPSKQAYLYVFDRVTAVGAGTATNWPGSAADPETHVVYAQAGNTPSARSLVEPPPGFSDIRYVSGLGGQQFREVLGPGDCCAADAPQRPSAPAAP